MSTVVPVLLMRTFTVASAVPVMEATTCSSGMGVGPVESMTVLPEGEVTGVVAAYRKIAEVRRTMPVALAVGMIFPLLDLIGFDATTTNTAEDVRLLAILYGGPSILFKLAAVALMRHFPIDEAEHRRIRDALAAAGHPA